MEMINTAAYQELSEADRPATPQDMAGLRQAMSALRHDLKLLMRENHNSLVRWMIGIYFGSMLLAGALLTLAFKGLMYLFYLDGKLG